MKRGLSGERMALNRRIDIGLPRAEEFPRFTHFSIEQPDDCEDCRQRVWAILESPGIAGAYEFRIAPGTSTSICVEAHLWQHHGIQKLARANHQLVAIQIAMKQMWRVPPGNTKTLSDPKKFLHPALDFVRRAKRNQSRQARSLPGGRGKISARMAS